MMLNKSNHHAARTHGLCTVNPPILFRSCHSPFLKARQKLVSLLWLGVPHNTSNSTQLPPLKPWHNKLSECLKGTTFWNCRRCARIPKQTAAHPWPNGPLKQWPQQSPPVCMLVQARSQWLVRLFFAPLLSFPVLQPSAAQASQPPSRPQLWFRSCSPTALASLPQEQLPLQLQLFRLVLVCS